MVGESVVAEGLEGQESPEESLSAAKSLTLFVHDKDKILKSTVSGLTWPNLDLLDLLHSSLRTVTFTL